MDYVLGKRKTQGRRGQSKQESDEVTKEKSKLTFRILERGTKLSVLYVSVFTKMNIQSLAGLE